MKWTRDMKEGRKEGIREIRQYLPDTRQEQTTRLLELPRNQTILHVLLSKPRNISSISRN